MIAAPSVTDDQALAIRVDAADLVATAGADVTLGALQAALEPHGVWLALDPPVPDEQTLGDALASGAPGPLAALYGPPRDQVLGAAFEAGNGTAVRTGARVVKNVAGFDLAKLLVGGCGAFGRLREVHLRLRARPQADRTTAWAGTREALAAATSRLMTGGAMLAACEVVSPGVVRSSGGTPSWLLLARAMGTGAGVAEELGAAAALMRDGRDVAVPDAWGDWRGAARSWSTVARIGADPAAWSDAVTLAEQAGATAFSITVPRGTVRAAFATGAAGPVSRLREGAARRGWPVTLERADDATLAAVGAWGLLNDGAARLVERLRAAFGNGSRPA